MEKSVTTLNDILDMSATTNKIDDDFLTAMRDATSYGSMGTLNLVSKACKTIAERISAGVAILYGGHWLTNESWYDLVNETCGAYVAKDCPTKCVVKAGKAYFKLENTDAGLNLVYTGTKPNQLFVKIADINEDESLVRIVATNTVYIRNNAKGTVVPFVTEHNSCYYYDESDGMIKEFFEEKKCHCGK